MSLPSNPAHKRDVPSTCLIPLRLTVRSLDIQPLFASGLRSQYWTMSRVSACFISQPHFQARDLPHPFNDAAPPSSRATSPHSGQVGCSRPSTPFTGPSAWNPKLIMVLPKVGISPHSGQGSVGLRPCIKNSRALPDAHAGIRPKAPLPPSPRIGPPPPHRSSLTGTVLCSRYSFELDGTHPQNSHPLRHRPLG